MWFWRLAAMLMAFGAIAAQAQIGPNSTALAINRTPISGGSSGQCLFINSGGQLSSQACGGSGTVTSVSVTTANGVSGSVATPTTTPAITLTLGAITPSSVAIGAAGILKLGNAFTSGAVTTNGYVTLQDSTGTTYKLNACTGC